VLARAIVDSGFLVALLDGTDAHHAWATGLAPTLRGPWWTAEACITETQFLIKPGGRAALDELLDWLERGALISRHLLPEELQPVKTELLRYNDRWVDFADACIIRLSDLAPNLPVATVDARDFAVYFRQRRGRRLVTPPGR
jgi:uncharacterized protein